MSLDGQKNDVRMKRYIQLKLFSQTVVRLAGVSRQEFTSAFQREKLEINMHDFC